MSSLAVLINNIMAKKYLSTSPTSITLNVNGVTRRISFENENVNTFFYTTADKDIIKAMDNHPWFDKYFTSIEVNDTPEPEPMPESETPAQDALTEITVASFSDAREYLAEAFGIARTSIRSKSAVEEAAKQHGIVFKGI